MYKVAAFLALCVAVASARNFVPSATLVHKGPALMTATVPGALGVVDPAFRCGGVGTPLQLRISECTGYCRLQPGRLYECEKDFMPSSAAQSLTLKVEICPTEGFCTQILQAIIPNSQVVPGSIYTAKYNIVPNDILSGLTVQFRAYISHTENPNVLEICVSANIDIL